MSRKTNIYDFKGIAGCVIYRSNRKTKLPVAVYHAAQAGLDSSNGPWAVVCEQHRSTLYLRTKQAALERHRHPTEWCETCRSLYSRREKVED